MLFADERPPSGLVMIGDMNVTWRIFWKIRFGCY